MRISHFTLTALAVVLFNNPMLTAASDHKKDKKPAEPCTITSPTTGDFYDLRTISVKPLKEGSKPAKNERTESWHSKGYDYKSNFTINFCGPVVEKIDKFEGISKDLTRNVSAYYELDGIYYSIGQQSAEPIFRGRRLVLQYENGSPCDTASSHCLHKKEGRFKNGKSHEDDEDDDPDDRPQKGGKGKNKDGDTRRKSTIISFLCDRDAVTPASVSFVGVSPDECAYSFEVRSAAACGGVSQVEQTLGPGGVFGVIALIAVLVYLVGGCVYQRTVMHARGWRQLPNYSMWASIGGFIRDIFIILTSSCSRLIPHSRGYRSLSVSANGHPPARRGGNRSDDENRLIDQLDEEWED